MTDDGSGLHPRLREPEDEDRVAQRVADLEVAARGHRDELFAVHLEDRGGRIHAGAAIELPQDRAGLGVVGFERAVTLAGESNAADLRISLPVAASSTYTNPVLPASTTAFLPPTMAMTGGLTASRSHTSCGTSW